MGMEERRSGHKVFTSKEMCNEAVTVTCLKNCFPKAFGDTSSPEIEDHFIHLIVIQMKILLVLSDLILLFAYNE
jgi:hypothetical protein